MYKNIFIIALLIFSCSANIANAQKIQKSRIKLESYKNPDKTIALSATIKARNRKYYPLKNVFISFYNINDTSKILLKKVETDRSGIALLTLSNQSNLYKDTSGMMSFEAIFEGNDTIKKAHKKLSFKEGNLNISTKLKDSLKFIIINAFENENKTIPNTEITLYIKGSFSLLKIGSVTTNENGTARFEFPNDIRGNSEGMVTLIAKIEDNDDFGNIIAQKKVNWAIPTISKTLNERGLTRPKAPLWMVITLIILLSLVWFHYGYIVYALVKIKKEYKK